MKLTNAEQPKVEREQPPLIAEIIAIDDQLRELMNRQVISITEHKTIRTLGDRKRELVRAASAIWGKGKREGQGPAHA